MSIDTEATIRARAYALWEQAGRPDGQDKAFWEMAEHELAEQSGLDGSAEDTETELPPVVAGLQAH